MPYVIYPLPTHPEETVRKNHFVTVFDVNYTGFIEKTAAISRQSARAMA
jgi:hypothetical protein